MKQEKFIIRSNNKNEKGNYDYFISVVNKRVQTSNDVKKAAYYYDRGIAEWRYNYLIKFSPNFSIISIKL